MPSDNHPLHEKRTSNTTGSFRMVPTRWGSFFGQITKERAQARVVVHRIIAVGDYGDFEALVANAQHFNL